MQWKLLLTALLLVFGVNCMEKGSFNTQTDAATHDSDPKFLNFDQVVIDGSHNGTDIDVGPILDLGLVTNPTGTPPVLGPLLGGLTGGDGGSSVNPVTFATLLTGSGVITITATDSTTVSHDLTAAEISALAVAQGKGALSDADIDISSVFDTLSLGTKTIDTASYNADAVAWTASNGTVSDTLSLISVSVLSSVETQILTPTPIGNSGNAGPGIGLAANENPGCIVHITLISSGPATPNKLTLQILPRPLLEDLLPSRAQFIVTADDSTSVSIDVTATTLQSAASYIGNDTWQISATSLGADLTPLVGKHITTIGFAVSIFQFASTQHIDFGPTGSSLILYYITPPFQTFLAEYFSLNITGSGPSTPVDFIYRGDGMNVQLILKADPAFPVFVPVPVDSAAIVAAITAQKPTLLSSQDVAYTDLVAIATASVTNPYNGGKIMGVTQTITADYGDSVLAPDATAAIEFRYDAPWGSQVLYTVEPILGTLTVTPGPGVSPFPQTINNDTIIMRIALRPLTIPAIPPVIYATQPYELRQRNLPAFKLVITGTPSDEDTHEFVAYCLCSQGPIAGKWEWTPLQCSILDDNAGVIGINHIVVDAAHGNITDYPPGYGNGIMIIPQKEYTGPWNYIRFVFLPTTIPSVLTGFGLQVIANAREVI